MILVNTQSLAWASLGASPGASLVVSLAAEEFGMLGARLELYEELY